MTIDATSFHCKRVPFWGNPGMVKNNNVYHANILKSFLSEDGETLELLVRA